jgi:hypothetical protein
MKNLPFSLLSSNELFTTSSRINEACKSTLNNDVYVSNLCSSIDQGNRDLSKGLGKSLNSDFTPLLLVQDLKRDHAFVGLRDFFTSYSHSSDPAKATAGRNLTAIFENIGNSAYRLGYVVETSKINSLLANLSVPAAVKDMECIGATEWFEQLKTSQSEFEKTYNAKIETDSAIDYPLVKNARDQITRYLKGLMNYIEINTDLDKAKFGPAKDKINEIITEIVAIIRARETRSENKKEKPDKASI